MFMCHKMFAVLGLSLVFLVKLRYRGVPQNGQPSLSSLEKKFSEHIHICFIMRNENDQRMNNTLYLHLLLLTNSSGMLTIQYINIMQFYLDIFI